MPDGIGAEGISERAHSPLRRNLIAVVDGCQEMHKAERMRPKEQLVHTNLSLFYMKSGDKKTAEHHGLQARISSWRENMAPPDPAAAGDPELQLVKPPQAAPVKIPEMPWKKKPPL